jgi:hypothetical protein
MKVTTFWHFAPCSVVEIYRRFGGAYYFHHQGDVSLSGFVEWLALQPSWLPDL